MQNNAMPNNAMQNQERRRIYLDHAATTPVDPAVVQAMLPYFTEFYGNPSSIHQAGRRAGVALEQARRTLAGLLGARPTEIIFTGGGTESDNAALRGLALARRAATGANRIVTSPVEHHAVLHTAEDLRDRYGFVLTLTPVDAQGRVEPEHFAATLGDGSDVAVASILYANNEVGTIQPIAALAELCRTRGVPFHTDAVQAVGKLPIRLNDLGVAALSGGAHKFYGPKGVGFLYLRSGTPFWPIQTGGSHEASRRAGTENVPLIVGMVKALELAVAAQAAETLRLAALRDRLIEGVLAQVEEAALTGAYLPGDATVRLANHASFVVRGVDAEGLLIALDLAGIAASSGSACASGSQRPSHVLEAMGVPAADAAGALRFSLGRTNSAADVDYTVASLAQTVDRIRGDSAAG